MKRHHAAMLALSALAVSSPGSARDEPTRTPMLAHVQSTFHLVVRAPYLEAFPLFGPNGERAWVGSHWDPKFFFPQPGNDVPGAVFAIHHGSTDSIWVNTAFDIEAHHAQYVYFIPDKLVTTIDVNFVAQDATHTKVSVVYTRTALDSSANEHVEALGKSDAEQGKEWEDAIRDYLQKRRR